MRKVNRHRTPFMAVVSILVMAALMPGVALSLCAQGTEQDWEKAAGGRQEFDLASIHQNKSDGPSYSNFALDNGNIYFAIGRNDVLVPEGTLFSAKNQALIRYILFAYKLGGTQELALRFDFYSELKLHVPDWVKTEHYDIEARAPEAVTKDQMRLMMQSLLADRFKLAVHWETREAPVFALILGRPQKLGPQIQPHPASDDCAATAFAENTGNRVRAQHSVSLSALPIPCGMIAHLPSSTAGSHHFGGRNVTLAMLASSLPAQTGLATLPRPVIDSTELKGGYDFMLEWTPEDTSEVDNRESGGTFREALKKQLGLRLEPEKAPVRVLVIDHVEQPSPN